MLELLARERPRIRTRFRAAIARVRDTWTLARLEAALESGTIAKVLDDVEAAGKELADTAADAHHAVAREAASFLSREVDKLVSYDMGNERAVQAVRRNRARLVGGLVDDHRTILVDVIADGTARGANPREMARGIRDSLGLSPPLARAVRSYAARLRDGDQAALGMKLRDARRDGTVETAIDQGKPLTDEQIDSMTARYAERAVAYRAEVIARTESLRAVHEGIVEAFDQAVESGQVEADRIVQKWHAGKEPRTRAWHAPMDGQERAWGEPFTSGHGVSLRYPGDPSAPADETIQCRCAVSRRIVRATSAAPATTATG